MATLARKISHLKDSIKSSALEFSYEKNNFSCECVDAFINDTRPEIQGSHSFEAHLTKT